MHAVPKNDRGPFYMTHNGISHQDLLKMADGLSESEKHEEAYRIYYTLANAENVNVQVKREAQFKIGQMAVAGIGIEQDYAIALDYYVSAASNGSRQALEKIEAMRINLDYLNREGVEFRNNVQSLINFFNAVASMYSRIDSIDERDKWAAKATTLINVQYQIEYIHSSFQKQMDVTGLVEYLWEEAKFCCGSKQFEAEYIICLFLAGLNNAEAEYRLGTIYFYGENVVIDVDKGLSWYKSSAEHGDVNAQSLLGFFYFSGEIVAKDIEVSKNYFEMAAKNKYANGIADTQLGTIYQQGDSGTKNVAKALEHLKRGAELGNVTAQYNLGCIYFEGTLVARNIDKALNYLEMAAKNKYANGKADYKIGSVYLEGNGVERDIPKALKHFKRGAELGNNDARVELVVLLSIEMDMEMEMEAEAGEYDE